MNKALIEEAERSVNPAVEAGPEHDELFRKLDFCAQELRKAILLRKSD